MELLIRFVVGGSIVSGFALLGDVLRPRGFAGLFAAAPSVALATLALTALSQGRAYAALEARSMTCGAAALLVYVWLCLYLMGRRHIRAPVATLCAIPMWGAVGWLGWLLWLR